MNRNTWLITFNGITFLAWAIFLALVVHDGFQFTTTAVTALAIAQGLAILEVVHAVLGIAGSKWLFTLLQVSSRFLVAAILVFMAGSFPASGTAPCGYVLIAFAWSITELVRCISYLTDLTKRSNSVIKWLRYSLFLVMYPVGVTGEFLILFGFWQWHNAQIDSIAIALGLIAVAYVIFFPVLFGHMMRQRKAKLG